MRWTGAASRRIPLFVAPDARRACPGPDPYRIHTSWPGVVALRYPNRLPSRKRGPPRIAVRGRPRLLQSVAPDGAKRRSGAHPGLSRQPRIGVRGRPRTVRPVCAGCGGGADAAIVWFAAFRAASEVRDGSPPSRGRPPLSRGQAKGAKARATRPSGASDARPCEMCACGRTRSGGEPGPCAAGAGGLRSRIDTPRRPGRRREIAACHGMSCFVMVRGEVGVAGGLPAGAVPSAALQPE